MSCESYVTELWEAALGAGPSAAFAAHLAGCDACRARLEAERELALRLDGEVRAALQVSPSLGFRAGALRRAEERARRRGRRAGWWPAAVAALLILGLRQLDRPATEPVSNPPERAVAIPAPPPERTSPVTPAIRPPRVRVAKALAPRRVEPEVLVPSDQALLLRRLVEGLETPSVQTSWFEGRESLASAVQPIDVAPIRVRPLSVQEEDVQPLRVEASLESVS